MSDNDNTNFTDDEIFIKKKKIISNIKDLTNEQKKEIFKLIIKNKIPYTKNNYGVHIDLNELNYNFIISIEKFIKYIHNIQTNILDYEKKIENYKNLD